MKLYVVSDGPPSLAVRMAIKALNIPCEEINVDYIASEHMTENYAKVKYLVAIQECKNVCENDDRCNRTKVWLFSLP